MTNWYKETKKLKKQQTHKKVFLGLKAPFVLSEGKMFMRL